MSFVTVVSLILITQSFYVALIHGGPGADPGVDRMYRIPFTSLYSRHPSLTSHLPYTSRFYYGPISHPPWRRPLPKNVGNGRQAPTCRMNTHHQHLSTYHDTNLSTDVGHEVNQVGSGGRGASQNKQLRSVAGRKEGNDDQGAY